MSKKKKEFKLGIWFLSIIGFVIFASLAANSIIMLSTDDSIDQKIAEAKEAARPADLDILALKAKDCDDCFDVQPILEIIKKENVKVKSEEWIEFDNEKSRELTSRYNITRLPAFIIRGEIEKEEALKKIWPQLGEVKDGVFIFNKTRPPYMQVYSGEIKGRIEVKLLTDRYCQECYNVTTHLGILKRMGMPTDNQRVVDTNLDDGKALVKKYNIELVPTVIVSGDLDEYPNFKKVWPQVGTIEPDGAYVMKEGVKGMGVYKNLKTGIITDPRKTANPETSTNSQK